MPGSLMRPLSSAVGSRGGNLMNRLHHVARLSIAVLLAAFAAPVVAQNNKNYVIELYPPTINAGVNANVKITIKNNSPAGNANFNSFRLAAPAGITITSAAKHAESAGYNADVSAPLGNGKYVEVRGISPSVGKGALFSLNLTLDGTCGGGGSWVNSAQPPATEVWSGSNLSGQQFTPTNPTAQTTVPCAVVLTVEPRDAVIVRDTVAPIDPHNGFAVITGAANSYPAGPDVVAQVRDAGGNPVATFAGPVSIVITSGPAGAGSGTLHTVNAVAGVATFTVGTLKLSVAGAYQLKATTGTSSSNPAPVFVGDGVLACASSDPNAPIPPEAQFSASPSGVDDPSDTAFAEGYRGPNKDNVQCVEINYAFTNNVLGGPVPVYDATGNTMPPNSVSFVWEDVPGQNPAFTYTVTFAPEVAGANGFPSKKSKYCVGVGKDCTIAGNQVELQGCVSPLVAFSSIPSGDPACVAGEMWTTIAAAECPDNPNGYACIKVTARIIDAKDPLIIR